VLKTVENLWAVGAPNHAGRAHSDPQTPYSWCGWGFLPIPWWEGLSPPLMGRGLAAPLQEPHPWSQPSASIFGPGPRSAVSIPQFLEFWIKHCTEVLSTIVRYTQKNTHRPPPGTPHTLPHRGLWTRRLCWVFTIVIRLTEKFS